MRRSLALLTFGCALVASVATSPPGWNVEAYEEGASWEVSTTWPTAALDVVVQGDEALSDAWGVLSVSVRVDDLVTVDDTPVTLDFVLYEEEARGDREIAAIRGWTLAAATEEDPTPEVVTLTDDDIDPSGTWRVEITLVNGEEATFDWSARAWFDYEGEAAHPGDDAVTIDLNPMAD